MKKVSFSTGYGTFFGLTSEGEEIMDRLIKKASENKSFFPLSVDYKEKFYASGRIPGGFFKREARPAEHEIIASRLTDRPIRPLFPSDFFNETQVLINVLSYDGTINPDILGTIGASAALSISDIPWKGPVASVRVGRVEGDFVVNPDFESLEKSDMEIIVSGTSDSILMVEGSADFISEDDFLSSVQYAHEVIKEIINKGEKTLYLAIYNSNNQRSYITVKLK